MAPQPEYDKEPKAPDKSGANFSSEETKALNNLVNDQQNSTDNKIANTTANSEVENKHVEALDDGQLRALLDEAITYKCPKDREGKSSLFKELLEEVEQDEQACEAAARNLNVGRRQRNSRDGRGTRHTVAQSNSLQDLVAALAAEPAPRRNHNRHHNQPPATTVSARAYHGGSLPSGVDTSFLLGEEPTPARGANYLATVRCVNPPPLTQHSVPASDVPHLDNRRSKPAFPMMYTARATLEIGSGGVSAGRATTTTTASNQVRTATTDPAHSLIPHAYQHPPTNMCNLSPKLQKKPSAKQRVDMNLKHITKKAGKQTQSNVSKGIKQPEKPSSSKPMTIFSQECKPVTKMKLAEIHGSKQTTTWKPLGMLEVEKRLGPVILPKRQKKQSVYQHRNKYAAGFWGDYQRPSIMGPPERIYKEYCSRRNPRLYYPKSNNKSHPNYHDKLYFKRAKEDEDDDSDIVTKMIAAAHQLAESNTESDERAVERNTSVTEEVRANKEAEPNNDPQSILLQALTPKTVGKMDGGGGNTKTNNILTHTEVKILKNEKRPHQAPIKIKRKCDEFITSIVKPHTETVAPENINNKPDSTITETSKVVENEGKINPQGYKNVPWKYKYNPEDWYAEQIKDGTQEWAGDVDKWYSTFDSVDNTYTTFKGGTHYDPFHQTFNDYNVTDDDDESFSETNSYIDNMYDFPLEPIRDWAQLYSKKKINNTQVPNNKNKKNTQKKPFNNHTAKSSYYQKNAVPYRWNQDYGNWQTSHHPDTWVRSNYPNSFVRRIAEDIYEQQCKYRKLVGDALVKPDLSSWNPTNVRKMTIGKSLSQYEEFDVTSLQNKDVTNNTDNTVCDNKESHTEEDGIEPAMGYQSKIFEFLAESFKEQFKVDNNLHATKRSSTPTDDLEVSIHSDTKKLSHEDKTIHNSDAMQTLENEAAVEAIGRENNEDILDNNDVKPQVEDIPIKTETDDTENVINNNDSVNLEDNLIEVHESVFPKNLLNSVTVFPAMSKTTDIPVNYEAPVILANCEAIDVPAKCEVVDILAKCEATDILVNEVATNIPANCEATNIPAKFEATDILVNEVATNIPANCEATNIPAKFEATDILVNEVATDIPANCEAINIPAKFEATTIPIKFEAPVILANCEAIDVPAKCEVVDILAKCEATDILVNEVATNIPANCEATNIPAKFEATDILVNEVVTDILANCEATNISAKFEATDNLANDVATDIPANCEAIDIPAKCEATDIPANDEATDIPANCEARDIPAKSEATDVPTKSGKSDITIDTVDSPSPDVVEGKCDSITFMDMSTIDKSASCFVENVTEPVDMHNAKQESTNTGGIVADISVTNANETGTELVDTSAKHPESECKQMEVVDAQTEASDKGIQFSQYYEIEQKLSEFLVFSNVVNKDNSDSVLGCYIEEVHNCDALEENLCLKNETEIVEATFLKDVVNNNSELVDATSSFYCDSEIKTKYLVNSEMCVPKQNKMDKDRQYGSEEPEVSNAVISLMKHDCDEQTQDPGLQALESQHSLTSTINILDNPISFITVDSSIPVENNNQAPSQKVRPSKKKKFDRESRKILEAIDTTKLRHSIISKLFHETVQRVASKLQKEVDSAIPFSCITTPEVVASCNTTSSTQSTVAVDTKPVQLGWMYRAVASVSASVADHAGGNSQQPRSVLSTSFNGLPLSRPNYGSMSATEEYKKPLDENGNSVQGFSSPLSGSSQHKKPRRKKSSKNETVIKSHQIDGYQGNKDLNEVLRFIESNADPPRSNGPKLRKARHEDEDKPKKRERRKDKSQPPQRAASLEEIAVSSLRELTASRPPPAKPERRSWGDDFRGEDEPGEFQTVTKKRRWRRRELALGEGSEGTGSRVPPPAPRPRRVSAPPSDRSDSNDDDSVHSLHSLPALNAGEPGRSTASYAEIARAANIPDLIESCNFYAEQSVAPPPADYPALEPRRRATAKAAPITQTARRVSKERVETAQSPPSSEPVAPDVVGRPAVILLDSARHHDIAGITFGFDINEQLLADGSRRGRCDLVLTLPPRYVPPPHDSSPQLQHIVQYVALAWEDVIRCSSGKVRYYSE